MEKKSINFWKTSNMAIDINEMRCPYCEKVFYEFDDHALDECPLCENEFISEPSVNSDDSYTYSLIVDAKTGIPSVIKLDEYEPVLKDYVPTEIHSGKATEAE